MLENFVTILDSNFLPQGLALAHSLRQFSKNYRLWVVCIDAKAFEVLSKVQFENIIPIHLTDHETSALLKVKDQRSRGEYCWTLTPFSFRFVFDIDPEVERVTYVDSDVFFFADPAPIFTELDLSSRSVLITEHAYSSENDQTASSGIYCVQFLVMHRNAEMIRRWWEARCLEWCYAKHEDGKFGDQKYLEAWEDMFPGMVHVMANREWIQAPWNANRFDCNKLLAWHFHDTRLVAFENGIKIWRGLYPLPFKNVQKVYFSYYRELKIACEVIYSVSGFTPRQKFPSRISRIAVILREVYRMIVRMNFGKTIWYK
jgi:hypothetical protein